MQKFNEMLQEQRADTHSARMLSSRLLIVGLAHTLKYRTWRRLLRRCLVTTVWLMIMETAPLSVYSAQRRSYSAAAPVIIQFGVAMVAASNASIQQEWLQLLLIYCLSDGGHSRLLRCADKFELT